MSSRWAGGGICIWAGGWQDVFMIWAGGEQEVGTSNSLLPLGQFNVVKSQTCVEGEGNQGIP